MAGTRLSPHTPRPGPTGVGIFPTKSRQGRDLRSESAIDRGARHRRMGHAARL